MKQHVEMPSRYDRKLLFVGALILTLAILLLGFLDGKVRVEAWVDEQRDTFAMQREQVKSETDRLVTEMSQMVEFYEQSWDLHERDAVPVEKYQQALAHTPAGIVSDVDLTVMPYSIVSSLTAPADRDRLATLLRLVRAYSPAPAVRLRDKGTMFGGFLYATRGDFMAAVPVLDNDAHKVIRQAGDVDAYIADHVSAVEAWLSALPPQTLKQNRVVSVPVLFDPDTGDKTSYLAAPVFHNGQRIANLVVRTSGRKVAEMLSGKNMRDGFFIVRADGARWTAIDNYGVDSARWQDALARSDEVFRQAGMRVQFTRSGPLLLITQQLFGVDWIALYIVDWQAALIALSGPLLPTLAGTLLMLCLIWGAVMLFDRFTLRPLTLKSDLLAESEAFNRIVVESAPVGLSVIDPADGSIVVQNAIAQGMLAGQPEGGRAFYRQLAQQDMRAGPAMPSAPPLAGPGSGENIITGPTGDLIEIETGMSWTRLRNRNVILFSLTNVSQRKQTERLLQDAKKASDQANQAKSLFLAAMSHEIRTPLHGALGNLELLARDADLLPGQKKRVDVIRHSFDALLNLINDILDLSKVEAHELKLAADSFDVVDLLERCAQTFAPVITDREIRFYCLFRSPFPRALIGDPHRIAQILMNLLSNAAKFTEAGAITLSAQHVSDEQGAWVRFEVSDSGCGMSEEDQDRIFQTFTQVGDAARSNKGTGLGLALCKSLCALMHGRIRVESEPGVGSIFTVDLPLIDDLQTPALAVAPSRRVHIVVVCENLLWRRSLVTLISQWGWHAIGIGATTQLDDQALETPTVLVTASDDGPGHDAAPVRDDRLLGSLQVSPRGPLFPQMLDGVIHIGAFVSPALRSTLDALVDGRAVEVQATRALPAAQQPDPALQDDRARFAILVAEDDLVNRTLIRNQLQACGYSRVTLTENGHAALAAWQAQGADMVITDLGMPGMDGIELLFALRARGATIPIVAMTASTQQDMAAGLSAFTCSLHKPVSIDQLSATLDRILLPPLPLSASQQGQALLSAQAYRPAAHADARPARIVPQDLKNAFAQTWPEDRQGLLDALAAQDADAFGKRLHKIYGALCILRETACADACRTLKTRSDENGIKTCDSASLHFIEIVDGIFHRYQASA